MSTLLLKLTVFNIAVIFSEPQLGFCLLLWGARPFIVYLYELICIKGEKDVRGRNFVLCVQEQRWEEAEDSVVFFLSLELRLDLILQENICRWKLRTSFHRSHCYTHRTYAVVYRTMVSIKGDTNEGRDVHFTWSKERSAALFGNSKICTFWTQKRWYLGKATFSGCELAAMATRSCSPLVVLHQCGGWGPGQGGTPPGLQEITKMEAEALWLDRWVGQPVKLGANVNETSLCLQILIHLEIEILHFALGHFELMSNYWQRKTTLFLALPLFQHIHIWYIFL